MDLFVTVSRPGAPDVVTKLHASVQEEGGIREGENK